ncbi:hypothetical protein DTO013E5_4830 [Penicillium roqueforti]|uniref:uncharacterized protein n=1 Tax=Penicillium roqueforti TaxID=5082 RepID=UPI00190A4E76|nr:uncharacterized protein LCP9604111_6138 [Penicillium roqueforti]KAF9247439.1 hypothetical protein LCP9604111_6138 [Penicillium roqueforti]KAI1834779.1 hypothetical protein CBS147337_4333 [Penicillium roqueforti]KAI2676622.1 hypothetical protein CBS147355_5724 [Penicillium roqueforti]KAI2683497.1 hypothetical protein LCP963914a_5898 [Penicillium roqueforti]KAI2702937.1 hypothetical protein CBS147372_3252 [Penicillium roqueforti]
MANAVCGPQKPSTKRPDDTTDLADLNTCPLNACCNVWGQCGTLELQDPRRRARMVAFLTVDASQINGSE